MRSKTPPKNSKPSTCPLEKRLLGLSGEHLHEPRPRRARAHHEQTHLGEDPRDVHVGAAPIDLRLSCAVRGRTFAGSMKMGDAVRVVLDAELFLGACEP